MSEEIDLSDPSLYLNRELELLSFQERVLEEAADPANPLLERVKYLAIVSSNMAEFYMVRVAGLLQQIDAGVSEVSRDGLTPAEQLEAVRDRVPRLLARNRVVYRELHSELAAQGIHLLDYEELDPEQRLAADGYFDDTVYPVLTPLAFDPGRPFPHISNLSLNLAVLVRGEGGEEHFARVKVPATLPRLVPICPPAGAGPLCNLRVRKREYHFVWLEQLIMTHLDTLFPGMQIMEAYPFRVTRDAEVEIQELEADDLLSSIEEGVRRRRFGSVVRVTTVPQTPRFVRDILLENLDLDEGEMVALDPPLGASELFGLYSIDRPDLKFEPHKPAVPAAFAGGDVDMFSAIRERDIMLHRPFESFDPVVRFIRQASRDPEVLAIKMTLYRVGRDSPVVRALLDAARAGKEVTALVELKARFDEESNIEWAKALEQQGVHVVYGLVGLKTHCKVTLVVRREGTTIHRYLHLGTGNYNVSTATQYTDLDLLTSDEDKADDVNALFNYITGYATESTYDHLLVAPIDMRESLNALVEREISHAREGRGGRMILKTNSLVDTSMIERLYRASQAGVDIDLIVRGVCCLRPGVPGVSENIRVRSIVGRFLEHTRIYYFHNAGELDCLIGSADLMPRNIDRRVEVLTPVDDPELVARLRDEVLGTYLTDTAKARLMRSDGAYVRATPEAEAEPLDAQHALLKRAARVRP